MGANISLHSQMPCFCLWFVDSPSLALQLVLLPPRPLLQPPIDLLPFNCVLVCTWTCEFVPRNCEVVVDTCKFVVLECTLQCAPNAIIQDLASSTCFVKLQHNRVLCFKIQWNNAFTSLLQGLVELVFLRFDKLATSWSYNASWSPYFSYC
jgi:hypothetical protein